MPDLEDSSLLLSCGIRPTKQRTRVYEALQRCTSHPTAEELHRKILGLSCAALDGNDRDRAIHGLDDSDGYDEPISLATVYNALHTLWKKGLVRPIHTVAGRRWDAGQHDHVHVYVDGAAEVVDLPTDLGDRLFAHIPRELLDEIGQRLGIAVDRVAVQVMARRRET